MSSLRNIAWWCGFLACALTAQSTVPGLDMMSVGLIILLQEKDYRNMAWFLPVCVLLQEGIGTRPFGSVIVWYAAVIVLFRIGRWLFEVESFVFIFLLAACLGGAYFAEAWLMAPLQGLTFNVADTVDLSLMQAIFIPVAWWLLVRTRRWSNDARDS